MPRRLSKWASILRAFGMGDAYNKWGGYEDNPILPVGFASDDADVRELLLRGRQACRNPRCPVCVAASTALPG